MPALAKPAQNIRDVIFFFFMLLAIGTIITVQLVQWYGFLKGFCYFITLLSQTKPSHESARTRAKVHVAIRKSDKPSDDLRQLNRIVKFK